MLRKLGLRRIALHGAFFDKQLLKQHDFLPTGPQYFVDGPSIRR